MNDPVAELAAHPGPIVFGEIHGTNEIPALVGAVVERAVRAGRAVRLCLEMPASALDAPDESWFWRSTDGRASTAMAALVDDARRLGASVVGIDPEHLRRDELGNEERRSSANFVAVVRADPTALTVALVGNLHSRADADGSPYATPPMAAIAATELPTLRTVRFEIDGGTAWVMTDAASQGGPVELPVRPSPHPPGLHWHDGLHEHHHATWAIGPVTASGPARRG